MQGLGVGAIMSMAYVFVATAYPQQLQARALALRSGAWTVFALVGPLVSRALTEAASWRFLFIGLIPLVLLAGALTLRGRPPLGSGGGQRSGGLTGQLVFSIGLAISGGVLLAGLEQKNLAVLAVMVIVGGIVMILTLRQVTPGGTLTARGACQRGSLPAASSRWRSSASRPFCRWR